jgi:amino acid transporter
MSSEDGSGSRLGTLSTLSIGIGGMVGGGIFAVTGLTVEITKGAAPLAFLIAGVVALLTSYSYLKLTLRFPGEGGTVDFLNRAFGAGLVTGAANVLLLFSYVVLIAIYAYAFGSYGASFFPEQDRTFWRHVLINAVIVGLLMLNVFGAKLVGAGTDYTTPLGIVMPLPEPGAGLALGAGTLLLTALQRRRRRSP